MKAKRQAKIREIIGSNRVETQEELIEYLKDAGYHVTQATISRDIREMKLVKRQTESGAYLYTAASDGLKGGYHIYHSALLNSVKSAESAMNNVVIKTYPGVANVVAAAIDSFQEPEILGCVAGDDTIILVSRSAEFAAEFAARMRENIKD